MPLTATIPTPTLPAGSPYLHFGHISAHEVFSSLMKREGWRPEQISGVVNGQREGWWGASPEAEAFLDELITWRELGIVMCSHREDYRSFDSSRTGP